MRAVAVRFRNGSVEREAGLIGVTPGAELRRLFDEKFRQLDVPLEGLALSRTLAERLRVVPGDSLDVEVLEEDRRIRRVRFSAVVDDFLGQSGYMNTAALHRLLGEDDLVTSVAITVDPSEENRLFALIKQLPNVAGVTRRDSLLRFFREQAAQSLTIFTFALAIFSSIIAIGVVYNNARIALAQRSRELASLRVLGFTRNEVAAVLIGEQMSQVVLAIPPGLALGALLAMLMQKSIDPELFRLPLIIASTTYAFATLVVLGAALASAFLVRRQADRLDLIGVLKARD
jgi:putative ABC transport system permease protein